MSGSHKRNILFLREGIGFLRDSVLSESDKEDHG